LNHRFKSHFFEQLNREGIGEQRKRKYRTILKKIVKLKIENNQKGVDKFFNYLQECGYTFESRKTEWYIFRKFMKFVNSNLKWDYRLKNTERRLPDILTLDEVLKLLKNTKNSRDRAIVSLLFDSGMRTGELVN
jgi:site-specific recombinase XerD